MGFPLFVSVNSNRECQRVFGYFTRRLGMLAYVRVSVSGFRESQMNQETRVSRRKTRTFPDKLSDGSVNSKWPISQPKPSSPSEIRTKTHWLTGDPRKPLNLRHFKKWAFLVHSANCGPGVDSSAAGSGWATAGPPGFNRGDLMRAQSNQGLGLILIQASVLRPGR